MKLASPTVPRQPLPEPTEADLDHSFQRMRRAQWPATRAQCDAVMQRIVKVFAQALLLGKLAGGQHHQRPAVMHPAVMETDVARRARRFAPPTPRKPPTRSGKDAAAGRDD